MRTITGISRSCSIKTLAGLVGLICGCSATKITSTTASKPGGLSAPQQGTAGGLNSPKSQKQSKEDPASTPGSDIAQSIKNTGRGATEPSVSIDVDDEESKLAVAALDAKFAALPPGGSFDTKPPVTAVLARSEARVVFLPATPDGLSVDIPAASKLRIKEIMQNELGKTNFRITSYADGNTLDQGAEGVLTIGMFKNVGGGQRPGFARRGAVFMVEGGVTESILLHEVGHAIGLLHHSEFDWRHRPLMPQFLFEIVGTGRAFLGSADNDSVMGYGTNFSEGDIRTINYLYPTIAGPSRPLGNIKPGTEAETGLLYIRGVEDKSMQIQVPTPSVPVDPSKGWKWRRTMSDDFGLATQLTPPCDASVVVGEPCAIRGLTCSMSGMRSAISGRDDTPGLACAHAGDLL